MYQRSVGRVRNSRRASGTGHWWSWGLLWSTVLCVGLTTGCTALRETDDGEDTMDPGTPPGDPVVVENPIGCRGRVCSAAAPCGSGQRCLEGVCVTAGDPCQDDSSCQDDSRCYKGTCLGWDACKKLGSFDPECKGVAFTPAEFKAPVIGCKLAGFQSLSVPIVADLDRDGKPEVLTVAHGVGIVVMSGQDCKELWRKNIVLQASNQGNLAVADLDGDGFGEIVAVDSANRVIVLDYKGNLLATSPTPTQETNSNGQLWSAPAIVDVDGVAPPEIIAGAQVSRFVRGTPSKITVLWTKPNRAESLGSLPVAADLDGDGRPEVISNDHVYDGITGADKTPPALSTKPFYPAVADFNGDGKPDLLLVNSGSGTQMVSVYDYTNKKTIFGPYRVAEGGWGGPAVIADFDGDKVPDFGLASASRYYTYALKCATTPKPADCTGTDPGVLWSKVTRDASSGGTGSSVFDFNGDGTAEVVYRDECWLRVYNGKDGKTLFAANITSNTCLELPVIADVDNDGHADIIVTSDSYGSCGATNPPEADTGTPWTGQTQGMIVLRDPMNRWMPSRPLWNQHSYHITNINDDLSVPTTEPDNWLSYNNYRQNVQGGGGSSGSVPDPTGRTVPGLDSTDCSKLWRLRGEVCNRGASPAPAPLYASFYEGHPDSGGKLICTAKTALPTAPGACQPVTCDWNNPPARGVDLYLRVGDDGKGGRLGGQCKDKNDLAHQPAATCSGIPG